VLVDIRFGVGQVNLPCFWAYVGECIQNMGEFFSGEVLWIVLSTICCPILTICKYPSSRK
jgi:hypothetical protein